jgi:hypothetical protein
MNKRLKKKCIKKTINAPKKIVLSKYICPICGYHVIPEAESFLCALCRKHYRISELAENNLLPSHEERLEISRLLDSIKSE